MNTTEGLAPLCRVLRISPSRVAIGLCFTENVKAGEWNGRFWGRGGMHRSERSGVTGIPEWRKPPTLMFL